MGDADTRYKQQPAKQTASLASAKAAASKSPTPLRFSGGKPANSGWLADAYGKVRQQGGVISTLSNAGRNLGAAIGRALPGTTRNGNNAQALASRYGVTPNDAAARQAGQTAAAAFGFATRNANNPAALAARYGTTPPGGQQPWSDIPEAARQYFNMPKVSAGSTPPPMYNPATNPYAQASATNAWNYQRQKRILDAWAGRMTGQAAEYFSRPVAQLPPAQPQPTGYGYGWGGYGGGGGGGGGYDSQREYYNQMVNWSINQPDRQG